MSEREEVCRYCGTASTPHYAMTCIQTLHLQLTTAERERDEARRERDEGKQRAEYWKAEHNAANVEIDTLRHRAERAERVVALLRSVAPLYCEELHHDKKDRHRYGEACPVQTRVEEALTEYDRETV